MVESSDFSICRIMPSATLDILNSCFLLWCLFFSCLLKILFWEWRLREDIPNTSCLRGKMFNFSLLEMISCDSLWTVFIALNYIPLYPVYYIYFCKCVCVPFGHAVRVDLRTTSRSLFSSSTTWGPGIRLRSLNLATSAFTYWTILLASAQSFCYEREFISLFFSISINNHNAKIPLLFCECAFSCSLISIYYFDLLLWVRSVASSRLVNKSRFELKLYCTTFWRGDI